MKCWSVVATVVLAAAPLFAQEGGMGPGHMGEMQGLMMPGMGPATMRMMLYAPPHLLARRDALGLTAEQVSRLTALRDGAKAAFDAAESEAQTHTKELDRAANAAQPDTAALRAHFEAAHAAMGRAHWLALVAAVQARSVLNDAQRQKLAVWVDSMQAWMQQHRQMMQPSSHH